MRGELPLLVSADRAADLESLVRFAEHRRTKRFGGGLQKIGEFSISIPVLESAEETRRLKQVIEQLVMDKFKGETKMLNARNAINANDYDDYFKIFCVKK